MILGGPLPHPSVKTEEHVPVEQRDPRQTIKAVTLGVAAVGAAVGFLLLVLWFTDRGAVEIALGDDVFEAGRTDIIAEEIRENGPIKYADLIGGRQNIILQHIGDDDDTGWYAFDLIRPGQPDECQLNWVEEIKKFRDSCDESVEIPGTGFGQPTYPIEIEDGRITINFRAEDGDLDAGGDSDDDTEEPADS